MNHPFDDRCADPDTGSPASPSEIQTEKWLAGQYGDTAMLALAHLTLLRLDGPLDAAALKQAAAGLWWRHDSLRIGLSPDGQLRRVYDDLPLPWSSHDFSPDGASAETRLAEHVQARLRTPFDPAHPPLLQLELLRLDVDRHVLLLHAHELVLDRRTTGRLLAALAQDYGEFVAGREPAELPIPKRPPRRWPGGGRATRACPIRWPCRPTARSRRGRTSTPSARDACCLRPPSPACAGSRGSAASRCTTCCWLATRPS